MSVDEIDSFHRVRSVDSDEPEIGDELSEARSNRECRRSSVKADGSRTGAAKSPTCSRPNCVLVAGDVQGDRAEGPRNEGEADARKDGQERRPDPPVFGAPAEVFLFQYCRQVDAAVLEQVKAFAINKSLMTNARVCYGVVDGRDSRRLVRAYPQCFPGRRKQGDHRMEADLERVERLLALILLHDVRDAPQAEKAAVLCRAAFSNVCGLLREGRRN